MKMIKKFWDLIPISICLLIKIILLIIEKSMNLVLRGLPAGILFWFFIVSVLLLAGCIIRKVFSWLAAKHSQYLHIAKIILSILYGVGILLSLMMGVLYSALACHAEDVVIENGTKMVACDTSFLDLSMDYYAYENALFRGKQPLKVIRNKTYWIYDAKGELLETGTYDY
jgi:lysylphosphatidylglycerol synthetase-like protein (DUF2156 family)